jgi:hypothetical protein
MNLETALRQTAQGIEDRIVEYSHGCYSTCNCGLVAKALGATDDIIYDSIELMTSRDDVHHVNGMYGYASIVNVCPLTDLPITNVLRILSDAGMSAQDIADLENLSNPQIRKRAGLTIERCNNRTAVAAYMRAFADMREEQSEQRASAPSADLAIAPTHIVTQSVELAGA